MPQFVIEREMPGVGGLSASDLKGASRTSCSVLRDLGPDIQWVHSYVTADKIYCIYRAPSEDLIRQHSISIELGLPGKRGDQRRRVLNGQTAVAHLLEDPRNLAVGRQRRIDVDADLRRHRLQCRHQPRDNEL